MDLSNDIVSKSIIWATENRYRYKDAKKFKDITKLIARGTMGSSTQKYAAVLAPITNTHSYTSDDIVGVSVNGGHISRRIKFDQKELMLAVQARATIITDDWDNRDRNYNTGEREVADFLIALGYNEYGMTGVWKPTEL
jgi:hypothetical protein